MTRSLFLFTLLIFIALSACDNSADPAGTSTSTGSSTAADSPAEYLAKADMDDPTYLQYTADDREAMTYYYLRYPEVPGIDSVRGYGEGGVQMPTFDPATGRFELYFPELRGDTLLLTGVDEAATPFRLVGPFTAGAAVRRITLGGTETALRPTVPAVRVAPQLVNRNEPLFADLAETPEANFTAALLPAATADTAFNRRINTDIYHAVTGDSTRTVLGPEFKQAIAAFADTLMAGYLTDKPERSEVIEYPFSYSSQDDITMTVYWNQNDLFTFALYFYNYSGGAHGNHYTELFSYRPSQGRRITLDDLITPARQEELLPALERALRRQYELDKDEPLANFLFDNEMTLTTNVALLPEGLLFSYSPYEIAAYAMGQIDLYLPFSELKGLLREPAVK